MQSGRGVMLMAAVGSAPVPYVEDQYRDLLVVDFLQDSPGTGPYPPRPRVAHKLRGLPWPEVLREPVNDAPYLLADGTIKPIERGAGIIAEDDLVSHRLQASLSLDLLPRYERFARFDAGPGFTGCGGVGKVFQQPGYLIRRQPLQFSG